MAAAEIQVVNPANLLKIESFLSDPSYKEVIESSSSFNSRLCAERRMRMPFIDTQTGVAQTHCNLYMHKRQRMPGAREGQVYTYPQQRWRKARRQYLAPQSSRWGWGAAPEPVVETANEDSTGLPAEVAGGEDSRDGSQTQPSASKEDSKQEWLYDEGIMDEIAEMEEPEPESDEDYFDDTYANRRRRRGGGVGPRGGRKSKTGEETPAKRGRAGRGRRRAAQGMLPYEVPGDAEKPYGCELCGALYKTRPGLTYHYTHTHKEPKEGASDGDSRESGRGNATEGAGNTGATSGNSGAAPSGNTPASEYQDSYVSFLSNPAAAAVVGAAARRPTPPPRPASADTSSSDSTPAAPAVAPDVPTPPPAEAAPAPAAPAASAAATAEPASASSESTKDSDSKQVSPSPYCDFCLGDDRENKKTKTPELLVSCSDCGRSGKPERNRSATYLAEDFDSFEAKMLANDNIDEPITPKTCQTGESVERVLDEKANGKEISVTPNEFKAKDTTLNGVKRVSHGAKDEAVSKNNNEIDSNSHRTKVAKSTTALKSRRVKIESPVRVTRQGKRCSRSGKSY